MKVLNITLHAINNYGSVLQTFATETIFKKLGCEVETIDYIRKTARLNSASEILKAKNLSPKLKLKTLIHHIFFKNSSGNRTTKFKLFRNKYLNLTDKYYSNEELKNNPPFADIYCTGSDQTWNTVCQGGVPMAFFLDFVPSDKIKISYAASFGINKIPENDKAEVKKLLSSYSYISVREQSGVDILNELGFKSTLVLDPTLTLEESDWNEFSESRLFKEEYIFAYQLNRNPKFTEYINKFSEKKGLKLVLVRSRKEPVPKNGICITDASPQEWLSLVKNAKYVITDSFHCTAFCILFHRQFIVIMPPQYSIRISDFLKEINLSDRILTDFNVYNLIDKQIDFAPIDKWLEYKREHTVDFLKSAIYKK